MPFLQHVTRDQAKENIMSKWKTWGHAGQSEEEILRIFTTRRKRKRSDFQPDSRYIEKATAEYLKNGGVITKLPMRWEKCQK